MRDPLLFKLRSGLSRFAAGAWGAVINLHGGAASKFWSQVTHLYPNSARGLLDGTFYSPLNMHTDKTNKIALKTVSKIKIDIFQKLTSVSALSEGNPTHTL